MWFGRHSNENDKKVDGIFAMFCFFKRTKKIIVPCFRSQFEKSENNEDNLTTVVDSTAKSEASNTAEKAATTKDESNASKTSEQSLPKSNLKKPTHDKAQITDAKPKELPEMNVKEKIKFTFKSSEPTNKAAVADEVLSSKNSKNATNAQTSKQTANNANKESGVIAVSNNNGRTSSCVIDLKTVWFNFAAPPSVPITRKIDYTRLDWNLLSTASPGITAWMNPCNRFAIKFVQMMKAFHLRRTSVAACLMADGLEVQGIQKHPKVSNFRVCSKHRKIIIYLFNNNAKY